MFKLTKNKIMSNIKSFNEFISEGIDFDTLTRTVSYNPNHQENVDTSVENNPIINDGLIDGVEVWSIFKRKRGNRGDGNPLVYALKKEGWDFKSPKDKEAILHQFELVAEKFVKMYPHSLTIVIPSENELNQLIASVISQKATNVETVDDALRKMTTKEIDHIVLNDDDCLFRKHYTGIKFKRAYDKLCDYLDRMDEEKNGKFSRHYILDDEMRDILDKTLTLNKEKISKYATKINDRDILIIDDTISRGQSIKEACEIIKESYNPKTIKVLTLLSKLY